MQRANVVTMLGVVALALVAACGGQQAAPPPTPQPSPDSIANAERMRQDSLARAEQARQDSIRQAQEEAERLRRESEAEAARRLEGLRSVLAQIINFDFDRADVRPADAAILDAKLPVLQQNANVRIRISGHCDERGSDEYNLALGMRRANAAKQYLVDRGIDPGRIDVVSFGEERPLDPGHGEDSWARNRRAEFELVGGM